VADTERAGGVVESSEVEIQGSASHASFSLSIASGRLRGLIATLSGLAGVRSLNQATQDLTSAYAHEHSVLEARLAARAQLQRQLATAASETAAASLRAQISALDTRVAIERATLARLQHEGSNASLAVSVVPGVASRSTHAGASPLSRAFHDALHALEEILAVALVVLAIVLPFALTALALLWAASAIRQRARERAMRAA
jgi:hypothetical protein